MPRTWVVRRGLLAADALAASLALLVCEPGFPSLGREIGHALPLAFVPLTIGIADGLGLYARDQERADHSTADDLVGILQAVTLASWLMLAIPVVLSAVRVAQIRAVILTWGTTVLLMIVLRPAARAVRRRDHSCAQNTVIVGAGEIGQLVADKLMRNPHFRCRLVGFIDARPRERPPALAGVPILGDVDRLGEVISELGVERVVIAFSEESQRRTLEVLRAIASYRVHIDIVPRLFEALGPRARMHTLEGLPVVSLPPRLTNPITLAAKRTIDLMGAALGLIICLPLIVFIAFRIKRDSPGPVLYWSERVGRDGRRFHMCKFRTMRIEFCRGERYGSEAAQAQFTEMMSDPELRSEFEHTHKVRHDPRVTRFGAQLRRSYLDELPQLWNVLRGDLSLVGPRAITAEEFIELQPGLHSATSELPGGSGSQRLPGYWELLGLRPGLTGYWQITGGSQVGYGERLRLDLLYSADRSVKLDLLIIARTLAVLARRRTT